LLVYNTCWRCATLEWHKGVRQLEFRLWRERVPLVGRALVKRVYGVECLCLGPGRVLKYA